MLRRVWSSGAAVWVVVAACAVSGGCGYRPLDARERIGDDRQIAIALFSNSTRELGLERTLADSIHEEFERRGELDAVYAPSDTADLVLEGTVRDVIVSSDAFSSVALTLEDEVAVMLDVTIERGNGEVVLDREQWRFEERFLASEDAQVFETNKGQALRRLSARVASQLHDELYQAR